MLNIHFAQWQCPNRPESILRDGTRRPLSRQGCVECTDRFQTPANAVLSQGVWAIALTLAGTLLIVVSPTVAPGLPSLLLAAWKKLNETPLYDVLYSYVIFGANLFYMLAISSVFVLRVRLPDLAAAVSHLGLSNYPDALRRGGAPALGKHAGGSSEPGSIAGGNRHHPTRCTGLLPLSSKRYRHRSGGQTTDRSVTRRFARAASSTLYPA